MHQTPYESISNSQNDSDGSEALQDRSDQKAAGTLDALVAVRHVQKALGDARGVFRDRGFWSYQG